MSEETRKDQDPAQIKDVEIEPLSDEDLELASGGIELADRTGCSCDNTTSSCTG